MGTDSRLLGYLLETQYKVKEKVENKGITIPFHQRDLHIKTGNCNSGILARE